MVLYFAKHETPPLSTPANAKYTKTKSQTSFQIVPPTQEARHTHLVLVGDSVALAGDCHHLWSERGGDELGRVLGGVRLPLDQGGHRRAVRAVQSLGRLVAFMAIGESNHLRSGSITAKGVKRLCCRIVEPARRAFERPHPEMFSGPCIPERKQASICSLPLVYRESNKHSSRMKDAAVQLYPKPRGRRPGGNHRCTITTQTQ